jgi:para-nitrobenzyl esterase
MAGIRREKTYCEEEEMKKAFLFMISVVALAVVLAACSSTGSGDPVVRVTQAGVIEGKISPDGQSYMWLGIPFAKPPVGDLRWKPPQDPPAWSGQLATRQSANACPQVGSMYGPPFPGKDYSTLADTFYKVVGSEDCLYLNIYRPATQENNLPVWVYIHGGSNRVGATSTYDGSILAKNANMIVVIIPYRLNLFGWLTHPALRTGDPINDSGNYGLLDLIQGLKFIKNNIGYFGGDPNNVTISGQSAGSQNVNSLIVSPLARGLFHKAMPISAGLGAATRTSGEAKANALIDAFLIQDKLAADAASAVAYRATMSNAQINTYLRSKSTADIINIQMSPTGGKFGNGTYTALGSVVANVGDGTTLPADVAAAVNSGNYSNVPMIISNTAEEGKLFTQPAFKVWDGVRFNWMMQTNPDAPGLTLADLLDPAVIIPFTEAAYTTYSYNNANGLQPPPAITTLMFVAGSIDPTTIRYQAQPGSKVYAYSFNWAQQSEPWKTIYGAVHAGDLPFIFGDFVNLQLFSEGFSTQNRVGRVALSNAMQKSIAAFVRTGDPNNSTLGTTWLPAATGTDGKPKKLIFDADYTNLRISMTPN